MSMDALARLREWIEPILQNKYSRVGFFIILFIVALAIGAPVIAPKHYAEVDPQNRLQPPSLQHLFGTDELGRDVFSRVVYGARIALWVGMLVVFIEAAIGVTLGVLAGYYGGKVDKVISAVTDMVWAFPPLVLALGVVTLIGPGLVNVVTAVAIVSWPTFTRIVRAKVQSLVNREFVLAARAIGESDLNIMLRYLLPNVIPTIIVIAALSIPSAILSTTALSFLGFGAQPPTPDWGAMVSNGMPQLPRAPWVSSFPGIFIVITCLGFNLLGDGLRDILDPKLKV
ncbi:MAG: ABC transporter permease [Desulfurococcales archaeon]|nr:ABC transporter permease [Desulfurococcales archaeon]